MRLTELEQDGLHARLKLQDRKKAKPMYINRYTPHMLISLFASATSTNGRLALVA